MVRLALWPFFCSTTWQARCCSTDSCNSFVIYCACPLPCRGDRVEIRGLTGYDVTRGAQFLGQGWMTDAYFKVRECVARHKAPRQHMPVPGPIRHEAVLVSCGCTLLVFGVLMQT
jgi:hypothetical protein